jgi:hypothetical protein
VLSDMHPPIVPAAAAAGGGGGGLPAALGAAPVVSGGGSAIGAPIVRALSSKGQPSSCATSVEGLGAAALPPGSAVLLGNPLARLSHMSGISYTTHLPDSLEECDSFLAMADRQVEDAKQKVGGTCFHIRLATSSRCPVNNWQWLGLSAGLSSTSLCIDTVHCLVMPQRCTAAGLVMLGAAASIQLGRSPPVRTMP